LLDEPVTGEKGIGIFFWKKGIVSICGNYLQKNYCLNREIKWRKNSYGKVDKLKM